MKIYIRRFLEDMKPSDAMKVFGISSVPNPETLKSIYKQLSILHHPDKGGDVEKMKLVNQAYDVLKKMKGTGDGKKPEKSRAEREKEEGERNEKLYYEMKKIFEEDFDEKAILKYLQQFTSEELTIDIETNEAEMKKRKFVIFGLFAFNVDIKIHNVDNTTVFYLHLSITPQYNSNSGLGFIDIDERDIRFFVSSFTNIYHDHRKQKLGNSEYKGNIGHKTVQNYEELFPKAKLKKIFGGAPKKAFKKADMYLGLKRELPYVSVDNDFVFIYPLGKPSFPAYEPYISIWRSVFSMRGSKLVSWSFHSFHAIDPKTKKFAYPAWKFSYVSAPESEETLIKIVKVVNELKAYIERYKLDMKEDTLKMYEFLKDLVKKEFPREQS